MRLGALADLWWLAILVPVLVAGLFVYGHIKRKQTLARAGHHPLVQKLMATLSTEARMLKALLLGAAVLLVVFAALRPQFGVKPQRLRQSGLDIAVAFDISKSMLARDVQPSRLQAARTRLMSLLERLQGDRVALVPFAGVAFTQSPLTHDNSAIRLYLDSLDPRVMPVGGTNLAMAIQESVRLLTGRGDKAEGGNRSRVILLITDGEDVARDQGTQAREAARAAADAGIKLYAVGVGTRLGEPIPLYTSEGKHAGYQKDASGKPIYSKLNLTLLEELADLADPGDLEALRVFHFDGTRPVDDALVEALGSLQRSALESSIRRAYGEKFQYVLLPAILLLLAELLVRERKRAARRA